MKWKNLFIAFIGWLVFLLPLLISLIGLLLLSFWRLFINVVVAFVHPSWRAIIPPGSSQAPALDIKVGNEGDTFNNFGGIFSLRVKADVNVDHLREIIKSKVLDQKNSDRWKYRALRVVPKCFCGYYFWAPIDIDLEKHIWEFKDTKETFDDFCKRWSCLGFEGRAPWEFVLTQPTRGKYANKTMMTMKVSHAVSDIHILKVVLHAITNTVEHDVTRSKTMRTLNYSSLLQLVVNFPINCWKLRNLSKKYKPIEDHGDDETSKSSAAVTSVTLKLVKSCARATGLSFREIVCFTFVSAIRKFLLESIDNKVDKLGCMLVLPNPYPYPGMRTIRNGSAMVCPLSYPLEVASELDRLEVCSGKLKKDVSNGFYGTIYYLAFLTYILPAPILKMKAWRAIPTNISVLDMKMSNGSLHLFGDVNLPFDEVVEIMYPRVGHSCRNVNHGNDDITLNTLYLTLPFVDAAVFVTVGNTVSLTIFLKKLSALNGINPNAEAIISAYFQRELEELELKTRTKSSTITNRESEV